MQGEEMPLLKQKLTTLQVEELEQFIKKGSAYEIRRAQAIILLNDRVNTNLVESLTGFKRRQPFRLRNKYFKFGLEILKDPKRELKKLLTKKHIKEIIRIVQTTKPKNIADRYSNHDFWTTSILGDFIERHYGVKYQSRTSLYLIFRSAKFTYHKPGRVYEKHDAIKVKAWKAENEEKIFKALDDPNTIVLCEDEMILSTQTTFQKIWLPVGEFPKVEVSNTRKNRSVYGFLNIKTGQEHAFKTERQNMFITAEILKYVRAIYPTKKILLVWDGAGWHRGRVAQEFIKRDQNIETLHFPGYSPELNPQEHVWKSGRSQVSHNKFIENIDTATDEFVRFLNTNKFQYSLLGFSAF
jgi:transposase